MPKERLDILVMRQTGVSRSKAQGMVQLGQVLDAGGNALTKPGERYDDDTVFDIRAQDGYVSRGGEKLEAALEAFDTEPRGRVAIDVGASTGGFTDCLLEHGAAKVYAVDVGYGQLAWKLRQDPRVVVLERVNIRHLTPDQLDEAPSYFTVDCSFISLQLVLPPLKALLAAHAEGIVLIKPQFEAGRDQVGKGGVVRSEAVRQRVVEEVVAHASTVGFETRGVLPSPLLGPAGNREFLAHLVRPRHSTDS
jgi:23S rRNA (cytidine1920-2'-O)/16S rRNA (cytidine1409-2'-O)-methyltransferase